MQGGWYTMTSYERITKTMAHEGCDRIACDMWATKETTDALIQGTGSAGEREMHDRLGVDKIVWVNAPYPAAGEPEAGFSRRDAWGVQYREQAYRDGSYLESGHAPLAACSTVDEYERYPWPDPSRCDFAALARKAALEPGRAHMLDFISIFEIYTSMRSFENALADLYVEKELASYALERITAIQLEYIRRAFDAAGDHLDMVYFSDDMGMQDRQLISTEVWDEMMGPCAERIIDLVHSRGKKVFYHTDGSAPEIVDRLVSMGIDILNPIQHVCPGMERDRLKNLYGKKLTFHGAVENQMVLPFGTPAEVRKETHDCMRILGKGGGYIVASCHNLQPNTPLANIRAMYDAVMEAGDTYF
jgi:uroporphyrinogen decarboxylase